jgi:hypothetical protein
VEGLITCVVAVVFKLWVVDWPETAKFLNDKEREILKRRLMTDVGICEMNHLDRRALTRILKDWKIYLG